MPEFSSDRLIPYGTEVNLAIGYWMISKNVDTVLSVEANELSGTLINVTADNKTMTLPAATPGLSCTIVVEGNYIAKADPDGTEVIGSGGVGKYIGCTGVAGSFIKIRCNATGIWTILDSLGTWAYEA